MPDPRDANEEAEFESDVADDSREVGKKVYDQYAGAASDGTWREASDGTIRFTDSKVEITPKGDMFGPYADLKSFVKDHGLSGQRRAGESYTEVHHLVTTEACEKAGLDPEVAPCVAVDSWGHMNDLHGSAGLLSGTLYKDVDDMIKDHRDVYSSLDAPEWGERAASFIDENRPAFEDSLQREQRELFGESCESRPDVSGVEPASDSVSDSHDDSQVVNDIQDGSAFKY